MANLTDNLLRAAAEQAQRSAVRQDDLVLTYADLDDLSAGSTTPCICTRSRRPSPAG
jgi:hypothetical protein